MKKLAVFPHYPSFLKGEQFGFSFGWYFRDDTSEYCLVFGNSKTRELANTALEKEHPDVEVLNFDYEVPNRTGKVNKPSPHPKKEEVGR